MYCSLHKFRFTVALFQTSLDSQRIQETSFVYQRPERFSLLIQRIWSGILIFVNRDFAEEFNVEKKKNVWNRIALVLVITAVGIAGFLIGRYFSASEYQAERELNYKHNLSDLEGLGEIDGTIYVTGHKSPDSDTVGSSIAYAALLRELGYDAIPVVLGNINNETGFILESAGIDTPILLDDASGCNMILVDHCEYTQSAEGLQDAYVISIIDHHGDGSVTTGNPLIYDARPLGSTATIIWI